MTDPAFDIRTAFTTRALELDFKADSARVSLDTFRRVTPHDWTANLRATVLFRSADDPRYTLEFYLNCPVSGGSWTAPHCYRYAIDFRSCTLRGVHIRGELPVSSVAAQHRAKMILLSDDIAYRGLVLQQLTEIVEQFDTKPVSSQR